MGAGVPERTKGTGLRPVPPSGGRGFESRPRRQPAIIKTMITVSIMNKKITYTAVFTLIVIFSLIIIIYNYSNNQVEEKETRSYNIKGFCLYDQHNIICKIYINNTKNKDILYINNISIIYKNNTIQIPLLLKGVTAPRYSISIIKLNISINQIMLEETDYNKNIYLAYKYKNSINFSSTGNITIIVHKNYTFQLPPNKGIILPLDLEFNVSSTQGDYVVELCSNTSAYFDIKIFSWNDIIYYEYIGNLSGGCHYIPVPGTDIEQSLTISKITINIFNNNFNSTSYALNVTLGRGESAVLVIASNAGIDSLEVPMVPLREFIHS